MERTRRILCLALLALFLGLSVPASAQCGEGNPDCPLAPPQSQQIATHEQGGILYSAPVGPPASLVFNLVPLAFVEPVALPAGEAETGSGVPHFDRIPVRMRTQDPADVSCGVQSLGMALEALGGSAPTSEALLGFLLDNNYLYDFGTGVEELALAARSFGYAGSLAFHGWSLPQLQAELAAGRPVVVDLGANGPDEPGHFVTVTGISPDGSRVAYSDPVLGERIATTAEFLALWNLQGDSGVAVATTPPTPPGPDYEPWAEAALAMMATLALAPGMLNRRTRPGVGGAIVDPGDGSTPISTVSLEPPYAAPAGMKWVQGEAVYETRTRTVLDYEEIRKMVQKQVQIGIEYEKIPYTKRIELDEGWWVTTYRTETYIAYYKSVPYTAYRYQRYPTPYGWNTRRVAYTAYRSQPVYRTRQVETGKYWHKNLVTHEYTEYKTVEVPVYEMQWVQEGVQRVPVERELSEQMLVGYQWFLEASTEPWEEYDYKSILAGQWVAPPPQRIELEFDSNGNFDARATWSGLSDIDLLARMILTEEGNKLLDPETSEDAVGAAWAAYNRYLRALEQDAAYDYAFVYETDRDGKRIQTGASLSEILLREGQFHGLYSFSLSKAATDPASHPTYFGSDPDSGINAYWVAYHIAKGIIEGTIPDPIDGAIYYADARDAGEELIWLDRTVFWLQEGSIAYTIPQLEERGGFYPDAE